jgi:hypothetical protein
MRRAVLIVVVACQNRAPPAPRAPAPTHVLTTSFDQLVAQLASVDQTGIGFSPSVTGMQFLPIEASDEQSMLLLGRPPPVRSAILTQLVAGGAAALPALVRCIDDATPTRLPPMQGLMWTARNDEYDLNRRTTQLPPGVDLDRPAESPAGYTVTVGDLCFVAIGQIVNRSFAAVRYQPSGGLIISSPVTSAALREAVRREWGATTHASLRASLIRDFTEPDFEMRREGALVRLAYFEPDAVKPLVDAELARPTYDSDAIATLVRHLYGQSQTMRANELAAYIANSGSAAARDGVEQALFEDLAGQEAYEQKRVSPPTSGSTYRARECLVELYGRPPTVTSKDRPYPTHSSKYERERLEQLVSSLRALR